MMCYTIAMRDDSNTYSTHAYSDAYTFFAA
jgi:hypothetical protein